MRRLLPGWVLLSVSCTTVASRPLVIANPPLPSAPVVSLPALDEDGAAHLLNRAAFGPSPAELAAVQSMGASAWLAAQLTPGEDPALEARLAGFPTLKLSVGEALEQYPPLKKRLDELGLSKEDLADEDGKEKLRELRKDMKDELPKQLIIELTQARLLRAIESRRQLEEVLVDFWFNHFNVSAEKNRTRWMVTSYERDAIRPHVLGKFRELLGATAKHPAMLWYLDNWQSVRDGFEPRRRRNGKNMPTGLNENYARELLELHTLGVDAGYTQNDVHEAARALTGWSVELKRGGTFAFHAQAHDSGPKQIFGLSLEAGGGQSDGERLLDALARHPATAHHLARKLCMRFVNDDPPPELVERIAQVFLSTDGDLRATVQAIFESPEFWSARGTKTKTPLEFVASAVRAVGSLDQVQQPLARALETLGAPLYRCAPPTGYAEQASAWVSAGALVSRINFGLALAGGRVKGVRVRLPTRGEDAERTIDSVAAQVLGRAPSAQTRATLLKALGAKEEDGEARVPSPAVVAGLLLGSPEFQHQ